MMKVSWPAVFFLSAASTGLMILPALAAYIEPPRPQSSKSVAVVLKDAALVLTDFRFILMIVIYSGFWIMYFQMFDTVLWYLKAHVDMAPVDAAVNRGLVALGFSPVFKFDAQHVTVINGGTIIALQMLISAIVRKRRALPTMVVGVAIASLGFVLLAWSANPWVFLGAMIVFSIGEMTAHPKYLSYVGEIAPEDKKATYMGYAFLYGIIGSSVGPLLGAQLYVRLVDELHRPGTLWLLSAGLGGATVLGLAGYDRWLAPRRAASEG